MRPLQEEYRGVKKNTRVHTGKKTTHARTHIQKEERNTGRKSTRFDKYTENTLQYVHL